MIGASRRFRWATVVSVLALLLAGCGPDLPHAGKSGQSVSPPPEAVGPGLTGSVGLVARSCQGVAVTPANDVQRAIDSHPPGTTFCLTAGTYRLVTALAPKHGDALVGRQGAVLSGSKVLTAWRRDGKVWSAPGFLPAAPGTYGECVVSIPTCTYTQDVFSDGRRLRRVGSPSAVTAGTVYANYRTDTITVGEDPQLHLIEQAVAPSLIQGTVNDVTVANLVLEEAANQAQVGAIENRGATPPIGSGTGWRDPR